MLKANLKYLQTKREEVKGEFQSIHEAFSPSKILLATFLSYPFLYKSIQIEKNIENLDKIINRTNIYLKDLRDLADDGLDTKDKQFKAIYAGFVEVSNLSSRLRDIYFKVMRKNNKTSDYTYKECKQEIDSYNITYLSLMYGGYPNNNCKIC